MSASRVEERLPALVKAFGGQYQLRCEGFSLFPVLGPWVRGIQRARDVFHDVQAYLCFGVPTASAKLVEYGAEVGPPFRGGGLFHSSTVAFLPNDKLQ